MIAPGTARTVPIGNTVTTRLVGYTSRPNVQRGNSLDIHVAGSGEYVASLVRMHNINPDPLGAGEVIESISSIGAFTATPQRTQAGSYVQVPSHPSLTPQDAFTVCAFVYSTVPDRGRQGIISRWDDASSAGWAIFVDDDGHLAFAIGDGVAEPVVVRLSDALFTRVWYAVSASFDPDTRTVRLETVGVVNGFNSRFGPVAPFDGRASATARTAVRPADVDAPLVIGGLTEDVTAPDRLWVISTFNGKVDAPAILSGLVPADDFVSAAAAEAIARWDFGAEIARDGVGTDQISDVSGNGHHGRCVNQPFRGCTGWNWRGHDDNYRLAPEQYGALWFHDDSFDDCRWARAFSLAIPADTPSGVYAVRLEQGDVIDHVPFFVVPADNDERAPVAVLMSSYTFMAYGNESGHNPYPAGSAGHDTSELVWAGFRPMYDRDVDVHGHPAPWGLSSYDVHADGEGAAYMTWRKPLLTLRPGVMPAWNFPADMALAHFLETRGIPFDIITDHDINDEGALLLEKYSVVVTGSHPEYTTTRFNDAWETYLANGGRGLYLGGNGMYWVSAQHPEKPWVMEMRRGIGGDGGWVDSPGESYLSCTGERSGPWRFRGRAGYKIWGTSYCAHALEQGSYFEPMPDAADERIAWIFDGVDRTRRIGDFGLEYGGAAGVELDRYDLSLGTPPNALLLASSMEHGPYSIAVPEDSGADTEVQGTRNFNVRADITYFTTPNGGAMFASSSISWLHSLPWNGYDNNVAAITANVIERFAQAQALPAVL